MEKILVTGGAGFVGFNVASKLIQNYRVSILDNFSNYYSPLLKWKNATDLQKKGVKVIQADILNKKRLMKICKKINVEKIIHLAAQPGVRYSTKNPTYTLKVNIEGTSNLLEVARQLEIDRIILTSSSSVYGKVKYLPMNEKHPTNPKSYYGASKLSLENLVKVTNQLYPELETVIFRPFTIVGQRQRPDMAINIFVSKILSGEKITIFGDGNQTRDWTHVDNFVQATKLALEKESAKQQIFNIGAGTRISVNQVLEMIVEITCGNLEIEYQKYNKADVKDTFADISKAKRLLGYKPKKNLFDAIQEFKDYWEELQQEKILFNQKDSLINLRPTKIPT
ncbi:MAG: GDP-mannose 4,6-dehydratase [Asgard group archaeon]|nr:GDP-mannose 4,6-dehydratase [Asgard group archaeon]